MSRLWLLAGRYGVDLLIAIAAIESALEVAFRRDTLREPRTPLWFAVPMVAIVVLPLLGRRRFPFAALVALWLLGPLRDRGQPPYLDFVGGTGEDRIEYTVVAPRETCPL